MTVSPPQEPPTEPPTNSQKRTISLTQPTQAAGLERQLNRCNSSSSPSSSNTTKNSPPAFCTDPSIHSNVLAAYNHLWDTLEANTENLSSEVWSWVYQDGEFRFTPLGSLPPPEGVSPTESNVRQLWSLTFLAVRRVGGLR